MIAVRMTVHGLSEVMVRNDAERSREREDPEMKNLGSAALCAGVACVFAGAAHADFTGATVANLGDLGAGVDTWRVFVNFDSPTDAVLAVSGDEQYAPLVFTSLAGDALRNDGGALGGLIQEDAPSATGAAWDSWLTIGNESFIGNNTAFSPDFLGGDGIGSVVLGTAFTQANNGGYFNGDPGTPANGGSVLIAQFTVQGFAYSGTLNWQAPGGPVESSIFTVQTVPGPSALALLGLAVPFARRRRRV